MKDENVSKYERTYVKDLERDERCCFNSKFKCVGGDCESGIEKRCGELSEKPCNIQMSMNCEYLDLASCMENRYYCEVDENEECKNAINDWGYDIPCKRFDDLQFKGMDYYEYNC